MLKFKIMTWKTRSGRIAIEIGLVNDILKF